MENSTMENLRNFFDQCLELAPKPAHLRSQPPTMNEKSCKTERRRRNRKRMVERKKDLCHDDPTRLQHLSKMVEKQWRRWKSQNNEMEKLKQKLAGLMTDIERMNIQQRIEIIKKRLNLRHDDYIRSYKKAKQARIEFKNARLI